MGMRACSIYAAAVLAAGCDALFSIDRVGDGGPGDTTPAIDARPICVEDHFDGTLDGWDVFGGTKGVVTHIVNQQLHVDLPANPVTQDIYGGLSSKVSRNFAGQALEAEFVQVPPSSSPTEMDIQVKLDADNRYAFYEFQGILKAQKTVAGTTTYDLVTYDPSQHRFLRIRHDALANQIVFETRGADSDWMERVRTDSAFSLATMYLGVFGGSSNVAPAVTMIYDNVLVTGPCQL